MSFETVDIQYFTQLPNFKTHCHAPTNHETWYGLSESSTVTSANQLVPWASYDVANDRLVLTPELMTSSIASYVAAVTKVFHIVAYEKIDGNYSFVRANTENTLAIDFDEVMICLITVLSNS